MVSLEVLVVWVIMGCSWCCDSFLSLYTKKFWRDL